MRLTKFAARALPFAVMAAAGGWLLLGPWTFPEWTLLAAAGVIAIAALFVMADVLLTGWLRSHAGESVNLFSYLRSDSSRLLIGAGGISALAFYVALARGDLGANPARAARILLWISGAMTGAGMILEIGKVLGGGARPLTGVRARLMIPPLKKQIADAWDFQRICGARLLRSLLGFWMMSLLTLLLGGALCGALIWFGLSRATIPLSVMDFDAIPGFTKFGVFAFLALVSWVLSTMLLSAFRIGNRVRRIGRVKTGVVTRDVGLALETIGVLPTVVWGLGMVLGAGIVAVFASALYYYLAEKLHLPAIPAVILSVVAGVIGLWMVLVFPQTYVFPILAKRDCGWLRALDVSLELIALEGREAVVKSLLATAGFLSIGGIPFAVFLLMASVDKQELLVSAILHEKTTRDIEGVLTQQEVFLPAALQKHYTNFEKGRYLDALNGFQIYLRNHPEDALAMRGQALALLHMGNPKAREIVERWESLDPDSEEAKQRLTEIAEGQWKQEGALFLEADRKCTQRIGRGI